MALGACGYEDLAPTEDLSRTGGTDKGRVVAVADGDTITVVRESDDKEVRVRLLGIDSPEASTTRYGEIECGGVEAQAAMRELADGKRVHLVSDPTQDAVDRYGRVLAYVRPVGQKRTLQEQILTKGWAEVYVFNEPFQRVDRFEAAQARARDAGAGVYGLCDGDFHSSQG